MILAALLAQAMPSDPFAAPGTWTADASDGVSARLAPRASDDRAITLAYDFGHVSGYAVVRRAVPITFAANFLLTLRVRGTGGANDLQIKFVDASGTNVWWYRRSGFRASAEWQTLRIRPQDLSFAWGPATDRRLRRTATMEIVVARGRDGGAGTLAIGEPTLTPLPAPAPLPPIRASDPRAIDGDRSTAWTGKGGEALTLDFGGTKALGGVTLEWTRAAPRYAIDLSDDGIAWRTVRRVTDGNGGSDPIALPDTETRYLRVMLPPEAGPAALAELNVEPPAWGKDANAFVTALAEAQPRGVFPRGFSGEQSYWTLVGTDGGAQSGLIGEDGAIEVSKGGFTIEPFVVADGHVASWADVVETASLEAGYLPIPHVGWRGDGWTLDTSLFADTRTPRLMARWRLTNTGAKSRTLRLVLAIRPFQVNPPAQFLSQQGGVSPIGAIAWRDGALAVTTPPAMPGDAATVRTLRPLIAPSRIGTTSFDRGALARPAFVEGGPTIVDPTGLASATLAWDVPLAPGAGADVPMAIPSDGPGVLVDRTAFDAAHATTVADWRKTLDRVTLDVPPSRQAVADTLRTALAHVLMSRDGPALKPGTRSYDRSWIRDGAMMSDALLRLGVDGPPRAFADWYGSKLFANGKVPCCVDYRGADPVPENDAQGEYLHLTTQLYRYTHDRAALTRDWPRMEAALGYMERQRQSDRTPADRASDRGTHYGLMPPSISHEGYSAQAQYSLWDDFWALTGYTDAAFAARVLSRPEAATIGRDRDQFATDIHAAIAAAAAQWRIDYIPGATSLGDFDATSTTIALDPAGEQAALDPMLLRNTFEKQWQRIVARTAPGAAWSDYTPYELRNVGAFVRLGWRDRANAALDFYMRDRRPAAWNGWAEVVGRQPREVRFIGDMPHAWVASDFIRSALDLFAYDRPADAAVILAAGLDGRWLIGEGSRIAGLRTIYGRLDLHIRGDGDRLVAEIAGDARPPGGFVLPWPFAGTAASATIDGRAAPIAADGLHIPATGRPIRVVMTRRRAIAGTRWRPAR